ncbi:hypothetical protein LXL04_015580 [Taraxacum kok-saghyz]
MKSLLVLLLVLCTKIYHRFQQRRLVGLLKPPQTTCKIHVPYPRTTNAPLTELRTFHLFTFQNIRQKYTIWRYTLYNCSLHDHTFAKRRSDIVPYGDTLFTTDPYRNTVSRTR